MPFTRYLFWLFTRYILLWFYHVKNLSICSGLPYPRPEFPLSFPRVSHLRSGKVPESGSAMPRRTFTKTAVRDAAIRRPGLFKKWPSTTSIFSRSFDFIVYIIMSISHIIGDVYCMRDLRVQHVRPAFLVGQLVFAFGQDAPAMLSVTNRVRSFSASIAGSTWFEYGSGLVIFLRLGC